MVNEPVTVRLLRLSRELDRLARENGNIPDRAMDALIDAWSVMNDELVTAPVECGADVAAKFELLADMTREGDVYAIEPDLAARAMSDLRGLRNDQSTQDFGHPHPAYA